jgi:hypothetical protein
MKIALFPDLSVRAEIKMLTYCHIRFAFYFRPSLTSEKIANFWSYQKKQLVVG